MAFIQDLRSIRYIYIHIFTIIIIIVFIYHYYYYTGGCFLTSTENWKAP